LDKLIKNLGPRLAAANVGIFVRRLNRLEEPTTIVAAPTSRAVDPGHMGII